MPKEQNRAVSSRREKRISPFPQINSQSGNKESPVLTTCKADTEDVKEWEDVKCPVCFDTPHNAVLLLCSSHDKGCRPYMCNTGHHHSNCLDCFRVAFAAKSSSTTAATSFHESSLSVIRGEGTEHNSTRGTEQEILHHVDREREDKKVLTCPLCRGKIKGWTIVEKARRFMDTKARACALESCGFSGTYRELRSHVRVEHPQACPSEVDPERERSWRTLEQQHQLADIVGSRYFVADGSYGEWDLGLTPDEDYWSFLTVYLLGLLEPRSASRRPRASTGGGRWTGRLRRRRMTYSSHEGLPGWGNEGGTQGDGSGSNDNGANLLSL